MGNPKGFLTVRREGAGYRPVCERVRDYADVAVPRPDRDSREQSSRCMDCGTPFCHWACPVANYIPEWNDLLFRGHWKKAYELLSATNTMPEVTGRICPAICEHACVLGINDDPVTIRDNELTIAEHAFRAGIIKPEPPSQRSGKRVAVVGSGPAGLAAADRLNRAGHTVTVFERDERAGGILRYGIPDFKLEKKILDRRIAVWEAEGIVFKTGVSVGTDIPASEIVRKFDAICLASGCRVPRDLAIEGRGLRGVHFAMDYLIQSNKRLALAEIPETDLIDARGKRVLVIGGGDTGADCVGTANRQGASCVIQVEVLPRPGECRPDSEPWPKYPTVLKTSTSHEEGADRHWSVLTKKFTGERDRVKKAVCARFEPAGKNASGCPVMKEASGSEFEIEADLVILAIGFTHPEHTGIVKELNLELDERGTIKTDAAFMTSRKKVFAAGDARRGQSLVVWAIAEGRQAAASIDTFLRA